MTTTSAPAVQRIRRRGATTVSVLRLARTEARRILLHPVHFLFALVLVTLLVGAGGSPLQSFREPAIAAEGLEYVFLLYYGIVVFFAVNLVATSSRRHGAETQFDAVPVSGQARTVATCLAVLGPVAVAGLAAAGMFAMGGAANRADALTAVELLVIPSTALGAGLLGIAVARWLPWPGVALAVMVVVIMWVAVALTRGSWAWSVPWTTSYAFVQEPALRGGSQAWHAVYLAGLASLAALAAVLRYPSHRRALLATGMLVAAATVVAGTLQLP